MMGFNQTTLFLVVMICLTTFLFQWLTMLPANEKEKPYAVHNFMNIFISSNWSNYSSLQKRLYIHDKFRSWVAYNESSVIGELDPVLCRHPLWKPGADNTFKSQLSRTYVYGITHLKRLSMLEVVQRIQMLRRLSNVDISIIVLKSVVGSRDLSNLKERISSIANTFIYAIDNPVDINLFPASMRKAIENKPYRDDAADYIRLYTFALPYDKAIFLDLDMVVLKPIDHLFECDVDFMYISSLGSPLNAGMFVTRANRPELLNHMLSTLYVKSHTYSSQSCFDYLGCGPCKCKACDLHDSRGSMCHGQEGVEGFLHYYFIKRVKHSTDFPPTTIAAAPSGIPSTSIGTKHIEGGFISDFAYLDVTVKKISSCLYGYHQNFSDENCGMEWVHNGGTGAAVSPYITYGGGEWIKKELQSPNQNGRHIRSSGRSDDEYASHPLRIETQSEKPCAPEFWILGTRKGGTTALYTWMTEHPQVARLHIANKPQDGEVEEAISWQNLPNYNSHFRKANKGMLKGDSKVSRLIDDAQTLVETCGFKHVKVIALLRDPIKRAISNMQMRARLRTAGMNEHSNISEYIEKDLNAFEAAVARDPGWDAQMFPRHLKNWKSEQI